MPKRTEVVPGSRTNKTACLGTATHIEFETLC